jgi:hypothetical protein
MLCSLSLHLPEFDTLLRYIGCTLYDLQEVMPQCLAIIALRDSV